jgi:tetratricopeptide (TPR) repeat protein
MSLTKARRVLAAGKFEVVDNKTLVMRGEGLYGGGRSITLPLKDLKVSYGYGSGVFPNCLSFPNTAYSCVKLVSFATPEREMVEAVYVVARQAEREGFQPRDAEGEFQKAAVSYLAAAEKPELSLEVRRFKVQAEDALREKRFADVADLYGEALALAPWWPAGHYNRALVLSELKEYPDAIAEMKHYMRLSPDAGNLQAAQDEIFKWEAKVAK